MPACARSGWRFSERGQFVGWAKARSDVPTIYHRARREMVGTLRFAHPTAPADRGASGDNSEQCLCGWRGRDKSYWTGHHHETIRMLPSQRALFDIPRDICYLNAASYSPLPIRTLEAGRAAVGRKGRPWTLEASFANQQHERARTAAARLINAEPSDIALIPSISYGVATAAKLSDARPRHARPRAGKRSLLPCAGMACAGRGTGLCRRDGRAADDGDWTSAVLESIERSGAPPVSLASISSVHWSDGGLIDVDKVGAALRQRGAAFLIDATQSAGVLAMDVQASRSGFRDLPDLQMAARTLRPRLSLCRQTAPERHPAGADLRRPPQRARRERGLFHRPRLRSPMRAASTWASAIISSRWRWPRSAWR